jgi:IPT/TIG domain
VTVITPGGPSSMPIRVQVTTPEGVAWRDDIFIYETVYRSPRIHGPTPGAGPDSGGFELRFGGANLTGVAALMVGDVEAPFQVHDDGLLTATAPQRLPGTDFVYAISRSGYESNRVSLTYYPACGSPDYGSPPEIISAVPDRWQYTGGARVELHGSGFATAWRVRFEGVYPIPSGPLDFTAFNDNDIVFAVPVGPGGCLVPSQPRVAVANREGETLSDFQVRFEYPGNQRPVVSRVEPVSGSTDGEYQVTVHGQRLDNVIQIAVGHRICRDITSDGSTATGTMPADRPGKLGSADVAVTVDFVNNGPVTGILSDGFTFEPREAKT